MRGCLAGCEHVVSRGVAVWQRTSLLAVDWRRCVADSRLAAGGITAHTSVNAASRLDLLSTTL